MKQNRLDGVLTRNRKHLMLDLALAAFFLMALLFSGLALGSSLPKLSMAPQANDMARKATEAAGAPNDPAAEPPIVAYR